MFKIQKELDFLHRVHWPSQPDLFYLTLLWVLLDYFLWSKFEGKNQTPKTKWASNSGRQPDRGEEQLEVVWGGGGGARGTRGADYTSFLQREQREMSSIRVSRAPWAGGTWERSEVQLQVVCWCTSASLNIGKFKPESCGGRNTELEDRPLFSHIPTAWLWGKKLRFSLPYL